MNKTSLYKPDKSEKFTQANCHALTGKHPIDLVHLTGVGSLPFTNSPTVVLSGNYPHQCEIFIQSSEIELFIILNAESGRVRGERIQLKGPLKGLGLTLFEDHLSQLTDARFNQIALEAAREKLKDGTELVGYIVWGKYGFTMDETCEIDFRKLLQKYGRKERTIFTLLKSKKGTEFWEDKGGSWEGLFGLAKKSINRKHFFSYQKRRAARKN